MATIGAGVSSGVLCLPREDTTEIEGSKLRCGESSAPASEFEAIVCERREHAACRRRDSVRASRVDASDAVALTAHGGVERERPRTRHPVVYEYRGKFRQRINGGPRGSQRPAAGARSPENRDCGCWSV
jgi:hypothetical protein